MRRRLCCGVVVAWAFLALAGVSYGQGGTTQTLSGVVVDSGGGVVPGANVVAKHNGTGVTNSSVTNSEGAFSFPGLQIGTYTVTITLDGFKTFVSNNVVLTSGAGANVKATLEVGGLTEQVVVSSASEIVQTQSSTVSSTITRLNRQAPLVSPARGPPLLPGVTPGGNRRSSQRTSSGLINITLDGVSIQDNAARRPTASFKVVRVSTRSGDQRHDGVGRRWGRQGAVRSSSRPARARTSSPAAATSKFKRQAEREHLVQQPGRGRQIR